MRLGVSDEIFRRSAADRLDNRNVFVTEIASIRIDMPFLFRAIARIRAEMPVFVRILAMQPRIAKMMKPARPL